MADPTQGTFWRLYETMKRGQISRREFIQRATALGVGLPVIGFLLNALDYTGAAAQAGTPAAGGAPKRPDSGTENQKRGAGDELKILQWQAPTHMSPHTSNGTKDYLAACLVLEPLMNFTPDARLIPNLITDIPTFDNGLLAKDLKSVTYKLVDGIVWSDGEAFTSKDVKFTWQWIVEPSNNSTSIGVYDVIDSIDTPDDLTAVVHFKEPQIAWYSVHAGTTYGPVYPGHLWDFDPKKPNVIDTFRTAPIGTGPYKVDSFKPGDQGIYSINEKYREPNKPFFSKVNLKGGGEAVQAARAVLQTGEWDYAWNLQVEPTILHDLAKAGKGKLEVIPGTSDERIMINFSDPNKEVDGQRSHFGTPHPFLTDKAVRQALNVSCDRDTISKQFYEGPPGEPANPNALVGIPSMESHNTSYEFNVDKAKQILEDAGWKLNNNGVREKDGIELKVSYVTSINQVRQKTQQVIKQAWESMGIKVQLKQVDAGTYFDSGAGNEQTIYHFYNDLEMYTNNPASPYPTSFMKSWYAGPNGDNIAQKENGWSGLNESRYSNPDYDKLIEAAETETDAEKGAQLFIQMNDLLVNDVAVMPLVQRAADKYAISNRLNNDNVGLGPWENNYWNVANWNLAPGQS
ncbi:MAG TPA: peptide ABC transporter substrate-binding protein [Thermomicrobiales bacterium]|nr:peptide ABC transporter substrate-binding protein [Thermomicrobiales bacterium]